MAPGALRHRPRAAVLLTGAAALLVYAGLALGSGLDRMSAGQPSLAPRVPDLFASEALRAMGAQALGRGDAAAALRIGQQALRDAPTDPQSAALFGAGNLASGNAAVADRAFRIAGQLGWRVPITQNYWMSRALSQSDYPVAALRLDALLRQQPALLNERVLTDPMERNPAGRAALIGRMRLNPSWLPLYTKDVYRAPADVMLQRATVLTDAARSGLVLGCDAMVPTIDHLYELNLMPDAAIVWRAHCPAAGPGPVSDPAFALLDLERRYGMLSWQTVGNEGTTLGIEQVPGSGARRLTIEGGPATGKKLFLRQYLVAAPGPYVLRWQALDRAGKPVAAIVPAVNCAGTPNVWLEPQPGPVAGSWQAAITVTACPLQELAFAATPGLSDAMLQQITLTPR